jgi:hypothetical protein
MAPPWAGADHEGIAFENAVMDTARSSLFLHPAALARRRDTPPREDDADEPAPSGWHESSYELRSGLTVVEGPPPDEWPGRQ